MKTIKHSIVLIFKGIGKSFSEYPAAMASAVLFTGVMFVRIHMDWSVQENYTLLLNSLQWSLGLGAAFGLTASAFARSRYEGLKIFTLANILAGAVVAATFVLLYWVDGGKSSELSYLRVSAAIFISMLALLIIASLDKEQTDLAKSLFMFHKAFFISSIYGLVIYLGASGVAAAVRALLYREMPSNVFLYIGALSGLLAYAIFIGYFPDFRRDIVDERREIIQKQPKYIELLFDYVMVPLTLAMTLVLLMWTVQSILGSMKVPFMWLYGVAASYGVIGLWLHLMVTHNQAKTSVFYRKVYPFTALVILAFEANALRVQLGVWGLKTSEYWFGILLLISAVSAILLIIKKEKAHRAIIVILGVATLVSVLPWIGYQALPVKAQASRLEALLLEEGMLRDNEIVPAAREPDKIKREVITETTMFLANAENAKLPPWFDVRLADYTYFKDHMGFNQTWPDLDEIPETNEGIYLGLSEGTLDVSDYQWAIVLHGGERAVPFSFDGEKGNYRISIRKSMSGQIPSLEIILEDESIMKEDLAGYFQYISEKYPPGKGVPGEIPIEDMSVGFENEHIQVLLVMNYVNLNRDLKTGKEEYWIEFSAIYINEK